MFCLNVSSVEGDICLVQYESSDFLLKKLNDHTDDIEEFYNLLLCFCKIFPQMFNIFLGNG